MDVLCLGISVADAIGYPIDVLPEKARLAMFDNMELHTGGCAQNVATDLARLGFSAGLISKVGADGFGDFLIKEARTAGVDTAGVVRDAASSTAFTFIMVDSAGERRFLHTYGANATFEFSDIDSGLFANARILCVGGTGLMPLLDGEGTAEALRIARENGLTTCLDTAYNDRAENWMGLVGPCLPELDYFLPSEEEAEAISGLPNPEDMAAFFKERGCRAVAIKLSRRGCYLLSEECRGYFPAYKVKAVDTSGAGDSWVAGFLAGLLLGIPLEECADLANATAAHCIGSVGCTTGLRPLAEIQDFMARAEKLYSS